MRLHNVILSTLAAGVVATISTPTASAHADLTEHCSNAAFDSEIADYYADRPGSPPAIPARRLSVRGLMVMDALEAQGSAKVLKSTPALLSQVWVSVDSWGEDTQVHLVFPLENKHVIDVITNVPVTQPDDGSGFLDIYADHGDGVHGHVYSEKVAAIALAKLPRGGEATRLIGFYDQHGETIFATYASQATKTADAKAIAGFADTWAFAQSQESLCGK